MRSLKQNTEIYKIEGRIGVEAFSVMIHFRNSREILITYIDFVKSNKVCYKCRDNY